MRFAPTRTRLAAFTAAFVAGAALVAAAAVAQDRGDGANKRIAVRDAPGPAFDVSPTPQGFAAEALVVPTVYAGITIYPVGQHPGGPYGDLSTDWTFESRVYDPAIADDPTGLSVLSTALPDGYIRERMSATFATLRDGTTIIGESGVQYGDGRGYPITISRWLPAEYVVGEPYKLAAWGADAPVSMTLAVRDGREFVFVHRRPGVTTPDTQQVWFMDGDRVVEIESRRDNFEDLVKIALILAERFDSQATP